MTILMSDQSCQEVAISGNTNEKDGSGNRKRRLSKRERKNLKRKQRTTTHAPGDDDDATTASTHLVAEGPLSGTELLPDDVPKHFQHSIPTLEEYMINYVPAPPVKRATDEGVDNDAQSKSLGKWFPSASVIKSSVCYSNDYLAKLEKEKKRHAKENNNASPQHLATPEPKASLVLFYQYVSPTWSQAKVTSFLNYLTNIAKNHRPNIGGRIRVSIEGVNATVSAASTTSTTTSSNGNLEPEFEAAQTLRHFAQDLRQFDPVAFSNTDFKYVDGLSADRHFKELKLLPVKELVFYGIKEEDCSGATVSTAAAADASSSTGKEVKGGGVHLDAIEYHEMLKRKDAVVIDVRNHYEAAIGRFDGQMEKESKEQKGNDGAEYIDPKMRKSTDFTSWLAEPETKQKLEGKTVLMFCTGGIRCERASAYLNAQMGDEVKGVYQLHGGIERYLQAFPEGGFWRGKNFVFDKREAIGAGNVNGVGGVVRTDNNNPSGGNELLARKKEGASKTKAMGDDQPLDWGAECANCHNPWDRYIGKRKCYTCGVPVLVCDTCLSQSSSAQEKRKKKKKKKPTAEGEVVDKGEHSERANGDEKSNNDESMMRLRCPLCIDEGITVPAEEVEYTDNGVRGRRTRASSFSESGDIGESGVMGGAPMAVDNATHRTDSNSKAAKSVLKWGGGHAAKKKEKKKLSRRPCQFGSECIRKDCFFYHPERAS